MADISALGQLAPMEPLDLDLYPDSKGFRPIPPKGEYTLRAPESFPPEAFGRSNAGALTVQVDPTIVGGEHDGYLVKFTKVSAKQYRRDGKVVSQLGDYLRANGVRGQFTNEQEQADAAEGTANLTYQAFLDWEGRDKATGRKIEGMENFPSDGNGGYIPFVENGVDENGKTRRIRANVVVKRFIAKVE